MSSNSPTPPLAHRGVVLTRPAGQASALANLIADMGGRAILFPVIEILDVEDRGALDAIVDRLETFDLAIFISPNAVARGWEAIRARRLFPPKLRAAAIGRSSARELRRLGLAAVIAPAARSDSESLLEHPELQAIAGQRIVIFRGIGGRELLRDTLVARGAIVEYAECYRRLRPQADVASLLATWGRGEIDAAVVTSSEGLRNFAAMLGEPGRARLAQTPLFVPHPRIAETALELGLDKTIVTGAGDERIAARLVGHFSAG